MQPQHPATSATCRRRTASGVASVAEEATLRRSERGTSKGREGSAEGRSGRGEGAECSGLAVYIPRDYRRSG